MEEKQKLDNNIVTIKNLVDCYKIKLPLIKFVRNHMKVIIKFEFMKIYQTSRVSSKF